ncbi:DUF924 family protein [Rheinheimera maricola]|uniref:DUF924 domain-containing protein n=1 Tax=Rheinheimera maricola TaxID=2793282 RepID=A0ABS7X3L2_9GAMM|nr:DUF924 family protein [Rheinheimera maricola]MBZ9610150.1 DUF924 domain-containing protein [Rheinheimera maricola]
MVETVLDFWFKEISPKQWWAKDDAFDLLISQRFSALLQQAAAGELFGWRSSAHGRLAEIIVLDQFSRNIYRDKPTAFAQDAIALVLAQEAVRVRAMLELNADERNFLLMPYMHSESAVIHKQAEVLFKQFAPAANYEFELKHKVIIDRFGRYPHRNSILARTSTTEEAAFLRQPGSGF